VERNTLEKFFTGKWFVVPSYQRDYAWEQENIDDLLTDIEETIETKTSHYIGTFILSRTQDEGGYHVVDGQQRLTTLTMLLNAVIEHLPGEPKIINRYTFIRDGAKPRWRLELAEYNREFFTRMLNGEQPQAESKSQRLLRKAYDYIRGYIAEKAKNGNALDLYLNSVKQLEVMEFIETDEGKAIRIFQTVNDRGRPLAVVEKAKSLLIYYSNRFSNGKHDAQINEAFGDIYRDFSRLKEIGEGNDTKIALVAQSAFSEDSVMRYHFLSYDSDYYDFKPTLNYVLDGFLKKTLRAKQGNPDKLSSFMTSYVTDLRAFFSNFLGVVRRVESEPRYYKLLCVLGLSTHLYPLFVRLQGRGLLDTPVSKSHQLTFADLIEIADVRIYKTRGTDPAKDISHLAVDAATASPTTIASKLSDIVRRFMDDGKFESDLSGDMYSNEASLHILLEMGEAWALAQGNPGYSVKLLVELMRSRPTIEHVFAQNPVFAFPSRGFDSQDQYRLENNRPGNLSVLEKDLNSRCQDKTPEQKLQDASLYKQSGFDVTRALVAEVATSGGSFDAKSVESRTTRIAQFAKKRWPLWSMQSVTAGTE
jgi:uncharacterized protein with ParB-like and HNH nuclease domain